MGVQNHAMHTKSDSDATSVDAIATSPPRPLYFVQSPSHNDKMSISYTNSSPFASPPPHYYHCSPVHHSRESSTSRFSASHMLKSGSRSNGLSWKRLYHRNEGLEKSEMEEEEEEEEEDVDLFRFYVGCFVVSFVAVFTVFSLILWAVATTYPPQVHVQSMVFKSISIQSAEDDRGFKTGMITLNSTVKIFYRNQATFFGVHVLSSPFELYFEQFKMASGNMKNFYQSRKSHRLIVTSVSADQLPLYGAIPVFNEQVTQIEKLKLPLSLKFVIRSRAYVLGRLVKPTFHRKVTCVFILNGKKLGKPLNLAKDCTYDD